MMTRTASWSVVALLITTAGALAQEAPRVQETQQRCSSSARECEQEIRHMLSGRRYLGALILEQNPGILVKSINADGPAAHSDLKPGDRIIAVNGRQMAMAGVKEFKQALADVNDTGRIFMIVQRRGAYRKIELRLEPYPKAQVDKIIAAHLAQSHAGSVAASQP